MSNCLVVYSQSIDGQKFHIGDAVPDEMRSFCRKYNVPLNEEQKAALMDEEICYSKSNFVLTSQQLKKATKLNDISIRAIKLDTWGSILKFCVDCKKGLVKLRLTIPKKLLEMRDVAVRTRDSTIFSTRMQVPHDAREQIFSGDTNRFSIEEVSESYVIRYGNKLFGKEGYNGGMYTEMFADNSKIFNLKVGYILNEEIGQKICYVRLRSTLEEDEMVCARYCDDPARNTNCLSRALSAMKIKNT